MVLTPHVRRAVRIPLLAAGGIATGRGMLAAFALGAEGVQLGTRFALTRESSASEEFKRLCLSLEEGGTTLALKKLAPTRLVRNDFCRAVEEAESRGATAEELSALLGRGRPKRGIFEGDLSEGELEIGQAASLLRDLPPAGEVVRQIVREYDEALPTLGGSARSERAGRFECAGHGALPEFHHLVDAHFAVGRFQLLAAVRDDQQLVAQPQLGLALRHEILPVAADHHDQRILGQHDVLERMPALEHALVDLNLGQHRLHVLVHIDVEGDSRSS